MNFSFRFVLEKMFCILCRRLVTNQSPNVDMTRNLTQPATGAGRPDWFPFLVELHFCTSGTWSAGSIALHVGKSVTARAAWWQYSPRCTVYLETWHHHHGVLDSLVKKRWVLWFYSYKVSFMVLLLQLGLVRWGLVLGRGSMLLF